MNRVALLFLLAVFGSAQTREQRWQEDIRTLQDSIIRLHPNPFTVTTRDAFTSALAQISSSTASRSDFQVQSAVAKVVASIRDAHTNTRLTFAADRLYPIRVRWFPDGLFVVQAAEANIRALTRKVLKIGDKSAEEAYLAIRDYISYDNDPWARFWAGAFNYMVSPDLLREAGVIGASDSVAFEFEDGAAQPFTMTIEPRAVGLVSGPYLAEPRNPLYRRNGGQNYWYGYIEEARTFYIKYNVCANALALPMADFTRELVGAMTQRPTDRIVLDLRNNTGGDSSVLQILLNGLGAAFLRGDVNPSRGAYGIIGRETFSSASLNTADLKRNGVVLVGEPTGQGVNHFGQVSSFLLPNSRFSVNTSTRVFQAPDMPGPTINPDIAVDLTSGDFFADRDPILEAILNN